MTTIALNNLWGYLQGLSLSAKDRAWLAGKLQEPGKKDPTLMTKEEFFRHVDEALEQVKQGRVHRMLPDESLDDFLERVG
ncbi:MAG: surface protein [Bacteroidaceae bacterium]|nr:surface protein [Bacteroidaceae bacterium]